MLANFLQLPPDELRKMRQTIEMIERMPMEDREFLRLRIRQITERGPEVEAALKRWRPSVAAHHRGTLAKYWLSLSRDERTGLESELTALGPDAQQALLRQKLTDFEARMAASLESMRQRHIVPHQRGRNPG